MRARSSTTPGKKPIAFNSWNFTVSFPDSVVNKQIAWFQECIGLELQTETLEYFEGGNPGVVWRLPTRTQYPNLKFSRGVADQVALLKWFNSSRDQIAPVELRIKLSTEQKKVVELGFSGAFPVAWRGPALRADNNYLALESLEVAHQGMKVL